MDEDSDFYVFVRTPMIFVPNKEILYVKYETVFPNNYEKKQLYI